MATGDAAEAEAGFLPRFLGAVCGGGGGSCSDFLFLPGRDLGSRAADTTCRESPRQQEVFNIVTAILRTSTTSTNMTDS